MGAVWFAFVERLYEAHAESLWPRRGPVRASRNGDAGR